MTADRAAATPRSTAGWPRPPVGPRTTCSTPTPGTSGARTSPSGRGAPCARTTAPTATPGTRSRTTTPGPAPTAGTRTAWPASPTSATSSASASSLWNGADPILKERMFGLTGPQGNHGEDVKEYWWYLDGLPSHALLQWRYHYPQAPFPYEDLSRRTAGAARDDLEYELLDTGVFDDDRYWIVDVTYAKASPTDVLASSPSRTAGPTTATLHVLPDALVPQHVALDGERRHARRCISTATRSRVERPPARAATGSRPRRARRHRGPGRCSATTRPTPHASSARRR